MESKKSKDNLYRDYYIWRDGKEGKEPNNWRAYFGGSAWAYDETTNMYYLHMFSKKQPDLNWENPKVRDSVFEMMKWWLDKGIDGFRMDVINLISKVPGLPDSEAANELECTANGPYVHQYLQEMNREVLSKYNIMTVGEAPCAGTEDAKRYAGFDTNELNMIFHFEHMCLDGGDHRKWETTRFKLNDLKKVMTKWQDELSGCAWNSLYWNNHDPPRVVSRLGNDTTPLNWEKSAKMLATCLHMMQGTPYIYQGEELGMTNIAFDSIDDYRDIDSLNAYKEIREGRGMEETEILEYIHFSSRDNARTPMQWNTKDNAGFTKGTPWIKVNPNYTWINAQTALEDENSIFYYYQKLIQLRKEHEIIVYGKYQLILPENEDIFAYTRIFEDERLLILCNFSEKEIAYNLPEEFSGEKKLLICNYADNDSNKVLRPYEAKVYLYK
jgi:oligo-1,6-glucosidase